MTIRFRCKCGKALKASDEYAGKYAKCPACGNALQIPAIKTPDTLQTPEPKNVVLDQCADCGGKFPRQEMIEHQDKIICKQCFDESLEHTAKVKKLAIFSGVTVILTASICITLVILFFDFEKPHGNINDTASFILKEPPLVEPNSKPQEKQHSYIIGRDPQIEVRPSPQKDKEDTIEQPVGEILCLKGHTGSVNGAVFSPDGKYVITAGSDETVLWNAKTGKEIRRFGKGGSSADCVVFFPNANRVLSGHKDGNLRIWDIETGLELSVLSGHSASVDSIALSRDGRYALSGSSDLTIRLWNVETGKKICSLKPPSAQKGFVTSVAFSSDDQKIAAGVEEVRSTGQLGSPNFNITSIGIVCIWKFQPADGSVEANPLNEMVLDQAVVTSLTFLPDGKAVVFGTVGPFYIWHHELESEKKIVLNQWKTSPHMRVFLGHMRPSKQSGRYDTSRIVSLYSSSNGRRILSAGTDNTIRLWDVKTRKELCQFTDQGLTWAAFSPDGSLAISCSKDKTARLWRLPRPQKEGIAAVSDEAISKDATSDLSGFVESKRKDEGLGNEYLCLQGHTGAVEDVAISQDGCYLVSASFDETIRLWDVKAGAEIRRFGMGGGSVNSVVFFPSGKQVLAGHSDGTLRIWNVDTGKEVRQFGGQGKCVTSAALSPDGRYAVCGRLHCPNIEFWDVETGKKLQDYCLGRSAPLEAAPDPVPKNYGIHDPNFDKNYGINDVAFSHDGLKVATALETTPYGRELESGRPEGAHITLEFFEDKPEFRLREGSEGWIDGPVVCVNFSPDSQQLLFSGTGWIGVLGLKSEQQDTTSESSKIRAFSGGHSKPSTKRPGYYDGCRVSGLAISPNGRRALSGGYDNKVRLWDVKTGTELQQFSGHTEPVKSVAFSPNGRLAISGSEDKTIRLWNLPNEEVSGDAIPAKSLSRYGQDKASKLLPIFKEELKGTNPVRVRNPNNFSVTTGIRSGEYGKNLDVPANGVQTVYVPNGKYDIYFVYSNKPDALFQGDSFTLNNNGVEIQIVQIVNGNYNIRQVK